MPRLLPKVRPVNLGESVHAVLVSAILDGRLPPGTWLREPKLSEELGVSNTPVREALAQLIHEGLAERLPGRGVRVVVLDQRDVSEIYDLRAALECLAVRLCAVSRTDEVLERLRTLLSQMDRAREGGDMLEYRRIHREWHGELVKAAGNRRLMEAYAGIQLQVELLVSTTVHLPGKPDRSALEHREILEAIARGDGDHAQALMRVHIQQARVELLRTYSERLHPSKGGLAP